MFSFMTKRTIITTLASDDKAATTLEILQAWKDGGQKLSEHLTALCSSDLFKSLTPDGQAALVASKDSIAASVAAFPAELPSESNSPELFGKMLSAFGAAQVAVSNAAALVKNASLQIQAAATQAAADLQAKLDSGDLVTKAQLQTTLASAKEVSDTAIADAQSKAEVAVAAKLARIASRRTALASANLASPSDAVLSVDDAEFAAKQTAATARAEQLKAYKLSSARLTTLCWDTEEAAYQNILGVLSETQTAAAPKLNPFENSHRDGSESKTLINTVGVC
jgi:hypothetical protein